jgi:hypothetical protein
MIYAIGVIAIQVMTLVHVVRTGRTQPWLFVVLFLPLVGSVAYLIAEVLPEVLGSSAAGKAKSAARDLMDPERRLRAAVENAESLDTPQAFADLAREYARLGRYQDALAQFERAMTGLFADDPELSYAAAMAAFEGAEAGQLPWSEGRRYLERVELSDEKFRAKDRSLLRARLAAAEGRAEAADTEFRELTRGHSSPETRVRFAHFLYTQDRLDEARALLSEVLKEASRSTPHVRQMNADWFAQAQTAFNIVSAGRTKG